MDRTPGARVGTNRRWLAVRLTCDDFVHTGEDLRGLGSFDLIRVAIE